MWFLVPRQVPYSLYGPTLLGALRHGAFVPWELPGAATLAVGADAAPALRRGVLSEVAMGEPVI
jgi:hypothetical protein